MTLLHLALEHDWKRALGTGTYDMSTRGATIAEVGYLHCCGDTGQLETVARRLYSDVTEALLLVDIDQAALTRLGLTVRHETTSGEGGPDAAGETFPHVYGGGLPVAAVAGVTPYALPD